MTSRWIRVWAAALGLSAAGATVGCQEFAHARCRPRNGDYPVGSPRWVDKTLPFSLSELAMDRMVSSVNAALSEQLLSDEKVVVVLPVRLYEHDPSFPDALVTSGARIAVASQKSLRARLAVSARTLEVSGGRGELDGVCEFAVFVIGCVASGRRFTFAVELWDASSWVLAHREEHVLLPCRGGLLEVESVVRSE